MTIITDMNTNDYYIENAHLTLRKCAVCGKVFDIVGTDYWTYKRRVPSDTGKGTKLEWYCSWGCMRKSEKEEEERHPKRPYNFYNYEY